MCISLCACFALSPAPPGWSCGAGVCAWAWVAAAPRHSWLGCWGACVFVCAPRLYPATPGCSVRCGRVCLASGFGCAPTLLVGVLGCVCFRACAPLLPRHSWRGGVCVWGVVGFRLLSGFFLPLGARARGLLCATRPFPFTFWGGLLWREGVRESPWVGFVPPPPLLLLFFSGCGGVWFSALWCCSFVVSVAGCPGLGSRGLSPPFPSRSGCAFVFFFCPSLPQRGVCWRVRSFLSSRGPLLSVGCRRLWLGGPPVFHRGGPWVPSSVPSGWGVCPPHWVWVAGFLAVGLSRAPPPLSFGVGVCLFLPLPSLVWCTHWSALGVVNRVAVGACVLLGLAPAPWVGWVMYTLSSVALPVRLGSGSSGS